MTRNYRQLYSLLKLQGLTKEECVLEVSKGRTDSAKELTDAEWSVLILWLTPIHKAQHWQPKPGDRQRKKMISIARQMNWHMSTNRPIQDKGITLIMARLDNWALAQKFKKPLMQHSEQELNVLLSIFEEKVYKSYLKDLNR
ncbi:hypothetical protein MM236_19085 [Belliella sp. DSM 107340]|uniref:DUF1018 domain-containing protein n=1 Tax=Belliella calami TaxID=2923436 RepID=A0ABS9UUD9_9BACT|nr:hypothetical protein [Belliella calami]MCH7400108.1 hypothetical protein [Belliella calami]